MAHTYVYHIETIGLRFSQFMVLGEDLMAIFLFTDAIINNKPIKVFNNGNLSKFTIYDVINGVVKTLIKILKIHVCINYTILETESQYSY